MTPFPPLREGADHRLLFNSLPVKAAVLSGANDPGLLSEVERPRPDAVFKKPPDGSEFLAWIETAAAAPGAASD